MADILLHTEKMPQQAVERLAAAGVIAIKVRDLKSIKFVQPSSASIISNDFVWSLLQAIDKEADRLATVFVNSP